MVVKSNATHSEDCYCGVCTGEDAALEEMERGIVATENWRANL